MYLEDLANCWRGQDTVPLYVLPKETWRYSQESRCSSPSEVHDNPVHRKSRHLRTLISVISSKLFPESQAPPQSSCAIYVHLTNYPDTSARLARQTWERRAGVETSGNGGGGLGGVGSRKCSTCPTFFEPWKEKWRSGL